MKPWLLNIDHKMFYKGKENWNHKCLCALYHFLLSGVSENATIQYKPFWFPMEKQTSYT